MGKRISSDGPFSTASSIRAMWEEQDSRGRLKMRANGWVDKDGEPFSFITDDPSVEPIVENMPAMEQEIRKERMKEAQLALING